MHMKVILLKILSWKWANCMKATKEKPPYAIFDHDPQLPGNSSGTEAITARLMKEARGRSEDANNEAEQSEVKRMKVARNLRIQSIANGGMQSGTFDKGVRWAANQPPIKVQRGSAGERIRRGELHALQRILKSSIEPLPAARCSHNVPIIVSSGSREIGAESLDECGCSVPLVHCNTRKPCIASSSPSALGNLNTEERNVHILISPGPRENSAVTYEVAGLRNSASTGLTEPKC